MKIKKHVPSQNHEGYTVPFSLFSPLSPEESDAISRGREAFEAAHPGVRLFPDPFLPERPASPKYPLSAMRIVTGGDPLLTRTASAIAGEIKNRWNIDASILEESDPEAGLPSPAPLLLIGGADRNRRSMEIAKRYQAGLFCANFPGPGGWGVTTHWELEYGVTPRWILACEEESATAAIDAFLNGAIKTESSRPFLRWLHQIDPGRDGWEDLAGGDFQRWVSPRPSLVPEFNRWMEGGCKEPYRELFPNFYRSDFSKGMPYNAVMVDFGIDALRYYQYTGSREALEFFREMMWGFWAYLNDKDPRVYISDLDFRLGILCNLWNWIEHSPVITPEERETFPRLLLGAMRTARDYYTQNWKGKPGPHNHQTFKGRTLILGWRYFQRWDLPDLKRWKEDADQVFEAIDPRAFKHRENAGHYESFVPEHMLTWLEVTGRAVSREMRTTLMEFAKREWAMRDSALHSVDYGDSDPGMEIVRPMVVGPWLTGEEPGAEELVRMERTSLSLFPFRFPSPIESFPGILQGEEEPFVGPTGWWCLPLDPLLAKRYPLFGEPADRFDKLVFRSAWKSDAFYLGIEGIGNETVSHAHNEVNAVLRMNLSGRTWVVSNGYGRKPDLSDAAKAFRDRQRGPEDHNILVIRKADGGCEIPPVNALLNDLGDAPLPYSVTELFEYGGFHWRRHALIFPEIGMVMIDKVQPITDPANFAAVELQWNLLGARKNGSSSSLMFEQNGAALVFETFGTGNLVWEESQITAWRLLIKTGEYRFTNAMPTHCVLKAGETAFSGGKAHCFVSGFWIKGAVEASNWNPAIETLTLRLARALSPISQTTTRPWGRMEIAHEVFKVTLL